MKPVTLDELNVLGPERAWVTKSDQSVVLMYGPKVVGDTLVGYVGKQRERWPSAGLTQLRVQTPAHARTALLAVGVAAGLGGFVIAVEGGQGQSTAVGNGVCYKYPENPGCEP